MFGRRPGSLLFHARVSTCGFVGVAALVHYSNAEDTGAAYTLHLVRALTGWRHVVACSLAPAEWRHVAAWTGGIALPGTLFLVPVEGRHVVAFSTLELSSVARYICFAYKQVPPGLPEMPVVSMPVPELSPPPESAAQHRACDLAVAAIVLGRRSAPQRAETVALSMVGI